LVEHGAAIGPGFLLGSDVFVGPYVIFCNDMWPRTGKDGFDIDRLQKEWCVVVKDGASIGAQAVVLPGVTIGECALIAARAVVNRSVPPRQLFRRGGEIVPIASSQPAKRMRFADER
jgi:acetyltransferase-like isoleucine patch superfamily enzyme